MVTETKLAHCPDDGSVTFVLYEKDRNGNHYDYAYVIGDFSGWAPSAEYAMKRDEAKGCWWYTMTDVEKGREYMFQYYLVKEDATPGFSQAVRISDPFTEIVYDGNNDQYIPSSTYPDIPDYPSETSGLVSAFCAGEPEYQWQNDDFRIEDKNDLVIYEMHVRNFTCGAEAGVSHPGTFAGIAEKIPYLKELGVNCVELMPIHEFDEFENSRPSPVDGHMLYNVWGYSNVGFFAPKAAYASTGRFGMQVDELKNVIKQLHANGIEVILDVVFNHTAEGNENGPYISYRGIDNKTYYMLTPEGYYFNFSGCGNTLNCNNPNVRDMIVESLRYWVTDYHVDGFRFDLAAILGRDQNGCPMPNPPLLESLAHDPILGKTKLIAEAWDAGGLYQVGAFPSWGRWAEWNGKYRDSIRRFLKGDEHVLDDVKERIAGSADLYASQNRGVKASVNFITAHDGFTLMDLVSYNGKHNEANGEANRDGEDNNNSWNCGWEGECDDPGISFLRHKQIKNAVAMLMTSQGIPMILSGDEMGNTQYGNNNAYCQDNEIGWLDWNDLEKNADLYNFFRRMIKFRRTHKALRFEYHLGHCDYCGLGYPDFSWHGVKAWHPECGYNNLTAAFMLNGRYAETDGVPDDFIYVAMNMHWEMHGFELPQLPEGMAWHVFANTEMAAPDDICEPGEECVLADQREILVGPRSVMILVGRDTGDGR